MCHGTDWPEARSPHPNGSDLSRCIYGLLLLRRPGTIRRGGAVRQSARHPDPYGKSCVPGTQSPHGFWAQVSQRLNSGDHLQMTCPRTISGSMAGYRPVPSFSLRRNSHFSGYRLYKYRTSGIQCRA